MNKRKYHSIKKNLSSLIDSLEDIQTTNDYVRVRINKISEYSSRAFLQLDYLGIFLGYEGAPKRVRKVSKK